MRGRGIITILCAYVSVCSINNCPFRKHNAGNDISENKQYLQINVVNVGWLYYIPVMSTCTTTWAAIVMRTEEKKPCNNKACICH